MAIFGSPTYQSDAYRFQTNMGCLENEGDMVWCRVEISQADMETFADATGETSADLEDGSSFGLVKNIPISVLPVAINGTLAASLDSGSELLIDLDIVDNGGAAGAVATKVLDADFITDGGVLSDYNVTAGGTAPSGAADEEALRTLIATNSSTHYDLMLTLDTDAATVTTTGGTGAALILNICFKQAQRDLSDVKNRIIADGTAVTLN